MRMIAEGYRHGAIRADLVFTALGLLDKDRLISRPGWIRTGLAMEMLGLSQHTFHGRLRRGCTVLEAMQPVVTDAPRQRQRRARPMGRNTALTDMRRLTIEVEERFAKFLKTTPEVIAQLYDTGRFDDMVEQFEDTLRKYPLGDAYMLAFARQLDRRRGKPDTTNKPSEACLDSAIGLVDRYNDISPLDKSDYKALFWLAAVPPTELYQ